MNCNLLKIDEILIMIEGALHFEGVHSLNHLYVMLSLCTTTVLHVRVAFPSKGTIYGGW